MVVDVAKGILESMNLTLGTINPVDDEAPEGEVIFQNIVAGTEIAEHTKINISISNGARAPHDPNAGESFEGGDDSWIDPDVPDEGEGSGAEAPDIG